MFQPVWVRKSSCAYLVQQNFAPLQEFFTQQLKSSYALPLQAADISAQGQLVKSEGRNQHPQHVCNWGANIWQRWHPRSCFCPSPALSCVTKRTWQACSRSCSTGLESHERHSFLCISNWLTCNHYGSIAIFLPQVSRACCSKGHQVKTAGNSNRECAYVKRQWMWHMRCTGACKKPFFILFYFMMQGKYDQSSVQIKCTWISNLIRVQQVEIIWGCLSRDFTVTADASQVLCLTSISMVSVFQLQQVSVRRKKEKKKRRASYAKASQSESNHWPSTSVIGLITVHQM